MDIFKTIGAAWLVAAIPFCAILGCSHSGVRVVASSATYTNIGDLNWDEYKIPILSLYMGPKATVWINKDYLALTDVEVYGCVTNDTAALGIYDSREDKSVQLKMRFDPSATNALHEVKAPASD